MGLRVSLLARLLPFFADAGGVAHSFQVCDLQVWAVLPHGPARFNACASAPLFLLLQVVPHTPSRSAAIPSKLGPPSTCFCPAACFVCAAGGAAHSFQVGGYTFDAGPSFHMGLADPPGSSRNPLAQVLELLGERVECKRYSQVITDYMIVCLVEELL